MKGHQFFGSMAVAIACAVSLVGARQAPTAGATPRAATSAVPTHRSEDQSRPLAEPPWRVSGRNVPAESGNGTKPVSRLARAYGRLPLRFEANRGQTAAQVRFVARGGHGRVFLTSNEAVLALEQSALRIKLVGANRAPEVTGVDLLPGKSHYFLGRDPRAWQTNVPQYARVRYRDVYPGVDVMYYGRDGHLEYDFIIGPRTDPRRVTLAFEGSQGLRIDAAGDLLVRTAGGELRQHKPATYQEVGGVRRLVASRYVRRGPQTVGFEVGRYDMRRPLVIDPVLSFSTYLGGSDIDIGNGIAVDAAGNAYVTGEAASMDFPVTTGALQTTPGGSSDVFVAKFDPTGTALLYATYIGGVANDRGNAIAVDEAGSAYVTGRAASVDFPTTSDGFQRAFRGGIYDAFVAKVNDTGSALLYSTYLGGAFNDATFGVAVDASGSAYVTGGSNSEDFPVSPNAFQSVIGGPIVDAFVTKLTPDGTALSYSTYLGGSRKDRGNSIVVDAAGTAFVTGQTESADFPTLNAWQPTFAGGSYDGFVTGLNADGSALVYSSFLGGRLEDVGLGIALDSNTGAVYIGGFTDSDNFPTLNALQPAPGGGDCGASPCRDAFVAKVAPDGSELLFSTYLGGTGHENFVLEGESVAGIALAPSGDVYLTGATSSTDFPTTPDALQPAYGGAPDDAFVAGVSADGSALVYASYLGGEATDQGFGIAVDSSGAVYVTGETESTAFPTASPFQPGSGGRADAFVVKITMTGAAAADLFLEQLVSAEVATLGSDLTYFITVTNNGPADAVDVFVLDDLPASVTFVSCEASDGGVCDGLDSQRWVGFPTMAAGASVSVTLVVTVNDTAQVGEEIVNATTAVSSTRDPDATNDTATTTVLVVDPAEVPADSRMSRRSGQTVQLHGFTF